MRNYWRIPKDSDCSGCGACVNACPRKCIEMKMNHEGFLYPSKDSSVCINCGICEKVCPFSDNYSFQTTNTPQVFAAYDPKNRARSSSGGIFYTLARYVIEERNGWVYGAAFNPDFKVQHEGVNSIYELEKLRGSKYVQSNIKDSYERIKNLLIDGQYVLFVGTPCQVAGLRAYLKKDYCTLLTADLVCHGVPSQKLFDEHIKYIEESYNSKLVSYAFRKPDGWGGCEICDFANPKKHIELPSYSLSPFLYSFMQAYTYRESCYDCKFAKIPRQGDITLADFWGADKFFPKIDVSQGVSMILVNTEKGHEIFESAIKGCVVYESNIRDASCYNGNLTTMSKRPEVRNDVFMKINKYGYKYVAESVFRIKNYRILRLKLWLYSKPIIKNIINK